MVISLRSIWDKLVHSTSFSFVYFGRNLLNHLYLGELSSIIHIEILGIVGNVACQEDSSSFENSEIHMNWPCSRASDCRMLMEEILKVCSSTCPPQAQLQTSGNTKQKISNFSEHLQTYIPLGGTKFCDWIHRIDKHPHTVPDEQIPKAVFLMCTSRQLIESSHLRHKWARRDESHNTTLTPCQCSSVSCG